MEIIEIQERLLKTGSVTQAEIRGCSQSEVDGLEKTFGHTLPKAYREYLLSVGHSAGSFLAGTDTFFRHLPLLADEATELLNESLPESKLPPKAFVFYMHQGYEFGFFLIDDGDDPAVYQYIEGDDSPKIVWNSFTDYLLDLLRIFSTSIK